MSELVQGPFLQVYDAGEYSSHEKVPNRNRKAHRGSGVSILIAPGASLVRRVQQLLRWLKRNSSRRLLAGWLPDLASRRNLSHKGRSGTYAKRKQGTCVIDGQLLRHPCVIRLGRSRAWIHSRTSRRAILR